MEKELDILNKVKSVDPPPFLYTRIARRVTETAGKFVKPRTVVAILGIAAAVLVADALVLSNNVQDSQRNSRYSDLIPQNSLYR